MTSTTSEAFFEEKYRAADDPWQFAESPYELGRYDAILHALGGRRYRLAFEPGCSIGVLTERLAEHCDCVQASDLSTTAVAKAKSRCSRLQNVCVSHLSLQEQEPTGADLYVLSEIGYYTTREKLGHILQTHVDALAPSAIVLGCHWLGYSQDHIISGDDVHEVIDGLSGLKRDYSARHEGFRIDRWIKDKEAA